MDPVLERRTEFEFDGGLLRQYEQFFVARMPADELAVVNEAFTDLERRSILGHRWWGAAELRPAPASRCTPRSYRSWSSAWWRRSRAEPDDGTP